MRRYSSESLFEGLVLLGEQLNDVFGGISTTNLIPFQTEDVMEFFFFFFISLCIVVSPSAVALVNVYFMFISITVIPAI